MIVPLLLVARVDGLTVVRPNRGTARAIESKSKLDAVSAVDALSCHPCVLRSFGVEGTSVKH